MEEREKAIDLKRIASRWLKGAWIWLISGILAAVAGFFAAKLLVAPLYESSVLFYVNNSANKEANEDITTGQMDAAKRLVKTYGVILQNRSTLEQLAERLDDPYTYEELSACLSVSAVNDTEIMQVTVTLGDPYEAAKIANCIAEILPLRVSEIIEGASMQVIDDAYPNANPVSRSALSYGLICGALGVVLSSIAVVALSLLNDQIRGTEALRSFEYPVLAEISSLEAKEYGAYCYYRKKKNDEDKNE